MEKHIQLHMSSCQFINSSTFSLGKLRKKKNIKGQLNEIKRKIETNITFYINIWMDATKEKQSKGKFIFLLLAKDVT